MHAFCCNLFVQSVSEQTIQQKVLAIAKTMHAGYGIQMHNVQMHK